MTKLDEWDIFFLGLAKKYSEKSKDPSTKVGAVITCPKKLFVSAGFNGFARKIKDTPERLNDRDTKIKLTVHAEVNACIFAKRDLYGHSVYTHPFMPCDKCASYLIQNEIARVVAPYSDNPRWIDSFKAATELFEEAGVELVLAHNI